MLDRHDGSVVDGVGHFEICVVGWRRECYDWMLCFERDVNVSTRRGLRLYRDSPKQLMSLAGVWPVWEHGKMPNTEAAVEISW